MEWIILLGVVLWAAVLASRQKQQSAWLHPGTKPQAPVKPDGKINSAYKQEEISWYERQKRDIQQY